MLRFTPGSKRSSNGPITICGGPSAGAVLSSVDLEGADRLRAVEALVGLRARPGSRSTGRGSSRSCCRPRSTWSARSSRTRPAASPAAVSSSTESDCSSGRANASTRWPLCAAAPSTRAISAGWPSVSLVAASTAAWVTLPRKSTRVGVSSGYTSYAWRRVTSTTLVASIGVGHSCHADRAGELEQRGEAVGVDRDHAVDRAHARLRGEAHQHLCHRREVGREVDVLEVGLGAVLRVAGAVVVGRRPTSTRPRRRARASFHSDVRSSSPTESLPPFASTTPAAADEPAGRARLGVVLHHEQVPPRTVAAEQRRREPGGGGGVAGFALGLHELVVDLLDRVLHRAREVRVVAHVVELAERVGERERALVERGRDLHHLFDRQPPVDDRQRLGVHRGRHRDPGGGEVGADVGKLARRVEVRREAGNRQPRRQQRRLERVARVGERARRSLELDPRGLGVAVACRGERAAAPRRDRRASGRPRRERRARSG